jgi:hypothetical protein
MPTVFQSGNEELSALRREPTLERLVDYFDARLTEWSESMIHSELFTAGVFDDLAHAFRNGEAYDLLEVAVHLPWAGLSDRRFARAIELLAVLAYASGTTEMPAGLAEVWEKLRSRAVIIDEAKEGWDALNGHYRRTA